jgi:hypothetical protein
MKSKTIAGCLVVFLLALSPSVGLAQHAGLRIGVAQPHFGPLPVHGPVFSGHFGTRPVLGPVFQGPGTFVGVPSRMIPPPAFPIITPPVPTVIVPNHVLLPGQTAFPPAIVTPQPVIVSPVTPFLPGPVFARPVRPFPFIGIPRADVIRQFGPPSVTVITSRGETLHFPGGVTVIIQNGHVVGPR